MKKIKITLLALCMTFFALGAVGCNKNLPEPTDVGEYQVVSPDGTISADVNIDAGNKIT